MSLSLNGVLESPEVEKLQVELDQKISTIRSVVHRQSGIQRFRPIFINKPPKEVTSSTKKGKLTIKTNYTTTASGDTTPTLAQKR